MFQHFYKSKNSLACQVFFLACFLTCSQNSFAQNGDSTLAIYFNQNSGENVIVKKEGEPITVFVGEFNRKHSKSLKILSDSTILIKGEEILISTITSVSTQKGDMIRLGGILTGIGSVITVGSVLSLRAANKAIEADPLTIFVYLPVLILSGAGAIGGTIVTGTGLIVMLANSSSPVRVLMKPVIKPYVLK